MLTFLCIVKNLSLKLNLLKVTSDLDFKMLAELWFFRIVHSSKIKQAILLFYTDYRTNLMYIVLKNRCNGLWWNFVANFFVQSSLSCRIKYGFVYIHKSTDKFSKSEKWKLDKFPKGKDAVSLKV